MDRGLTQAIHQIRRSGRGRLAGETRPGPGTRPQAGRYADPNGVVGDKESVMSDLSAIVKAYDVRGTVPDQLNEEVARALGAAFVQTLRARRRAGRPIVIAHDMRESSPGSGRRVRRRRAARRGRTSIEAGLGSTDLLYYASGALDLPGAMFTASHNPAAVQRHQAVPGRRPADRAGQRPGRDPRPGAGDPRRSSRR